MKFNLIVLILILCLNIDSSASDELTEGFSIKDFQYLTIDDFSPLRKLRTIDEFKESYSKYIQECLDRRLTDSQGVACLIEYDLWDRELNYYYKQLMLILDKKEQTTLKVNQRNWLRERDKKFKVLALEVKREIQEEYSDEVEVDGKMYSLLFEGGKSDKFVPIVKARVLELKTLYEEKKAFVSKLKLY